MVIGHTHTNNRFFKVVEALLQIHSCFVFTQNKTMWTVSLHSATCSKMYKFKRHMQQYANYRSNLK